MWWWFLGCMRMLHLRVHFKYQYVVYVILLSVKTKKWEYECDSRCSKNVEEMTSYEHNLPPHTGAAVLQELNVFYTFIWLRSVCILIQKGSEDTCSTLVSMVQFLSDFCVHCVIISSDFLCPPFLFLTFAWWASANSILCTPLRSIFPWLSPCIFQREGNMTHSWLEENIF